MKQRHIRLELLQASPTDAVPQSILPNSSSVTRAVGWNLAARAAELKLSPGSAIDLAYRIRENTHPEFGGLEVEVVGMEIAASQSAQGLGSVCA